MRRSLATLLLLTFGSFLSAPLLATPYISYSELPVCCKGNGEHHGMMGMMMDRDPTGRQMSRIPEKCPSCPKDILPLTTQGHLFTLPSGGMLAANLLSHPARAVQTEARYRISSDRSRQKRGPPATSRS